jgi:hypothetical protein
MDMPATLVSFPRAPAYSLSPTDLLLSDGLDSRQNLAVPIKSMLYPLNYCVKNVGTVGALKGVGALHLRQFV